MLLRLALEVLIAAVVASASAAAGPEVNVRLEASFASPPFLLELLETAAQENSSAYFPLLDRIAEGYFAEKVSDHDIYTSFLVLLHREGFLAEEEARASFELAVSIHSAAPRIEAHYQYYDTEVLANLIVAQDAACPVWVHFQGKQYCSPTLERAQQDFGGTGDKGMLPFDRVVSLEEGLPIATLYVDIESPLFGHFHQTLSETAKSGRSAYRVRYRPSTTTRKPLMVSGYGVELALKRTDYIVIDDRGSAENTVVESSKEAGSEDVSTVEDLADLKPLSASELLNLGLKASSFVMESQDPFGTLLKVSQDFPKHSSSISKRNVSDAFKEEFLANREAFLYAGMNVVWVNGLQLDARQIDAFALLERLRHERQLVGSLKSAGLSAQEAIKLISHPKIAESKVVGEAQRYDYRDTLEGGSVIIWLNDIEKDKRYQTWPSEANALLQRVFPGQLPNVRRDIHNLVMPLDLTDIKDAKMLVENLQTFVKRLIPVRFGIVPFAKAGDDAAERQVKVVYHLLEHYGLGAVMAYLEASILDKTTQKVNEAHFEAAIKERKLRKNRSAVTFSSIVSNENNHLQSLHKYLRRLGADKTASLVFINGVAIPRNEEWLQAMSSRIELDLRVIQIQIMQGMIDEDASLSGHFLEGAVTQRNALIIPEDETAIKILDIGKLVDEHVDIYNVLPEISAGADSLKQFWAHLIVVADMDSDAGAQLVIDAMEYRKQQPETEITILHNGAPSTTLNFRSAKFFELSVGRDALTPENVQATISKNGKNPTDVNPEKPHELAETFWSSMQPFAKALGLQPGENGVVLNGRLIGPIPPAVEFASGDFDQLLSYERSRRITPANTALAALGLEDRLESLLAAATVSSLIALSTVSDVPEGIFEAAPSARIDTFSVWKTKESAILTGDAETASIHLTAAIDPTSEVAQRWLPILKVLSELSGVHMKLFLNPREKMKELPVKRFYRHVLDSKPSFDEDGSLRNLQATFEGLPKEALLNLAMDVPPAWLVAPKESIYDLDNIKLSALKEGADINAIYELEHILIEGHSRDTSTGQPPRGVQLLLGTKKNPHFADTLIMANVGYFQFKANPGYWNIQLQSGRSQQIFKIESIGGEGKTETGSNGDTHVALMSFQGKTLFPRLARKPGQESEDVLEGEPTEGSAKDYVSKAAKFASSLLSSVGMAPKPKHADINIFSVASGHLYERMLNIMMVSVMKHTNHSVKFWFIEQFLSPSFKQSLPALAAAYNFDFEMVTYKWPHWLRAQTEKQREIWGYKILFLDVLFPLSLDKVIFVDADQIVRTDMHDLVRHDLQGAPYGFTPMCDSRTEMEGFRFWKQGYWEKYLRGLPYHISALYVVDLVKFRQIAAGDRLRQQYHSLSADPNSLSNLDQDLPNHMQMVLPIHSLPQDWLWCETWCSDESLKTARTIDLCNNPLTKEPKLERARRQVPEWSLYDEEIERVFERARGEGGRRDGGEDGRGEEVLAAGANDGDGDGASDQEEPKKARDEL